MQIPEGAKLPWLVFVGVAVGVIFHNLVNSSRVLEVAVMVAVMVLCRRYGPLKRG